MYKKIDYRKEYLKLREDFDKEYVKEKSLKVISKIAKDSSFLKSKKIGIYYPIKNEIDLLGLLEKFPNKSFYLPKIVNDNIEFFEYKKNDELVLSDLNILEPKDESKKDIPELIFIPAILINDNNYRLGYGGGFYDRYLKDKNIIKIGITYDGFFSNFESEEHDIKLDSYITPSDYQNTAVILAAGDSTRFSKEYKTCEIINNRYLFEYSLSKFSNDFQKIVVLPFSMFFKVKKQKEVIYLIGKEKRCLSLLTAISFFKGNYIYIHDGARPYLDGSLINELLEKQKQDYDIIYPYKEQVDAIKDSDGRLYSNLEIVKTPQVIKKELFLKLNKNIITDFKDDVEMFKSQFKDLKIAKVLTNKRNDKITYKEDLEDFMLSKCKNIFVGHSFDIHKVSKKRKLFLAGLKISNNYGLVAHSDGDCILHAITEAIFGALSQRDLGFHFPDNKKEYKDISSLYFLEYAKKILDSKNYSIINIDIMLYYEAVKLNKHFDEMLKNLKNILNTPNISLKATTAEKLGKIGAKKAIGCECMLLVGDLCDN